MTILNGLNIFFNSLKIIALSELDLTNDALKIANDLMKIGIDMDSNRFSGRFFNKTVRFSFKKLLMFIEFSDKIGLHAN